MMPMAVVKWSLHSKLGLFFFCLLRLNLTLAISLPSEVGDAAAAANLRLADASSAWESAAAHAGPPHGSSRRTKPYKKGDPASWTRKYYGKPSATCYREPATDMLSPYFTSSGGLDDDLGDMIEKFPTTMLESEAPKHTDVIEGKLMPRQPEDPVASTWLSATYHLTCPVGGIMAVQFILGAAHRQGDNFVHLIHIFHIDGFMNSAFDANTGHWVTTFHHRWCIPIENYECRYVAFGHIYGRATATRVTMDLTLEDPIFHRQPQVFETCGPMGATGGTSAHSCIVERVDIHHPPNAVESRMMSKARTSVRVSGSEATADK